MEKKRPIQDYGAEAIYGVIKSYDEMGEAVVIVPNKWLIPPWDQRDFLCMLSDSQLFHIGDSIGIAVRLKRSSQAPTTVKLIHSLVRSAAADEAIFSKSLDRDLAQAIERLPVEAFRRLGHDWLSEFGT